MLNCDNNSNASGFEFMLYATLVSFVLANNLKSAEQNLLGLFLQQVGSQLLSLSLYNESIEELCKKNNNSNINVETETNEIDF